jgi:hypothetical protein
MPFFLPILGILVGTALIISAVFARPRSRLRALIGAAIISGIAALIIQQERLYAHIDLNPSVPQWQSLAGTWQRDRTRLVLLPSGRWECAVADRGEPPCDADVRRGRWSLHRDRQVELVDSVGGRVISMPVITDQGVFRLLQVPDSDPDSWDVSHGYERVSASSR